MGLISMFFSVVSDCIPCKVCAAVQFRSYFTYFTAVTFSYKIYEIDFMHFMHCVLQGLNQNFCQIKKTWHEVLSVRRQLFSYVKMISILLLLLPNLLLEVDGKPWKTSWSTNMRIMNSQIHLAFIWRWLSSASWASSLFPAEHLLGKLEGG